MKQEDGGDEEETEAITEEERLFDQRITARCVFLLVRWEKWKSEIVSPLLQIVMLMVLHQASTCDPSTAKRRNENRGNRKRHVFLLCFLLSNLIWLRMENPTEVGPTIVNDD